jgi:hypothetical protein
MLAKARTVRRSVLFIRLLLLLFKKTKNPCAG